MEKIGIVGGIGPSSTLDYYKGIINGYRARSAGDNYPQIIIDSLNLTEMYSCVANKHWDDFINRLVESIKTWQLAVLSSLSWRPTPLI
jgi:aspartate racemase